MTETTYRCNFCGLSDKDQPIKPMDFMGEDEDFHVCGKCVNVVANMMYEMSQISIRNPYDTTHNGPEGLARILKELTAHDLFSKCENFCHRCNTYSDGDICRFCGKPTCPVKVDSIGNSYTVSKDESTGSDVRHYILGSIDKEDYNGLK